MLKRITHTFIHVLDQDQALDFYAGKLGMVIHTDADLGVMRFLTVNFPDQPDVQLGLMVPGPPAYDDATAAQIRELVAKGQGAAASSSRPTIAAVPTRPCGPPGSNSPRSRSSASTASTARCAIPSATRSASRSRRTGRSSCRQPRSSRRRPDGKVLRRERAV